MSRVHRRLSRSQARFFGLFLHSLNRPTKRLRGRERKRFQVTKCILDYFKIDFSLRLCLTAAFLCLDYSCNELFAPSRVFLVGLHFFSAEILRIFGRDETTFIPNF